MQLLKHLETRLWKNHQATLFNRLARLLLAVFRVVSQSRIKLFAASLTYNTLLAAVPLLALIFTLLKSIGINDFLQKVVGNILEPLGNTGTELSHYLFTFINNAQAGMLGGIGILFLLYMSFKLFAQIETALNHIWQVPNSRPLTWRIPGYFAILLLSVAIAAIALGLNILFHRYFTGDELNQLPFGQLLSGYLVKLLSVLVTALLLALLYFMIPNTRVKFRSAYAGGLFCAFLWLPLTAIFSKILALSSSYSIIYSSFAGIVIGLVWLHILWLLFLSGALVSHFVQFPDRLHPA